MKNGNWVESCFRSYPTAHLRNHQSAQSEAKTTLIAQLGTQLALNRLHYLKMKMGGEWNQPKQEPDIPVEDVDIPSCDFTLYQKS